MNEWEAGEENRNVAQVGLLVAFRGFKCRAPARRGLRGQGNGDARPIPAPHGGQRLMAVGH